MGKYIYIFVRRKKKFRSSFSAIDRLSKLGCLRPSGLTGGFLLLQNFSVAISVSPHVCFILVLILISMFLGECTYELGIFQANRTLSVWGTKAELRTRVVFCNLVEAPQ